MIIGIDGNEANVENRVGVNTYAFELLHGLKKLESEWSKNHSLIVYLKEKPRKDLPLESNFFKYRILSGSSQWIFLKLTPYLFNNPERLSLFFTPSHYVPPVARVPRVCAIMDLGYLEFSEQFKRWDFWQLKLWSAYSIFVSKVVIAISDSTKKDIVRHYKFASKKVTVTPLAYDKNKFNTTRDLANMRRIKKKYSIVNDYILFMSTLKPSKNVVGLISAWAMVSPEFPEVQLIVAGKKGWMYQEIFEEVKRLNIREKVVFTDYVDEENKPDLIKGAKAFVLPSFWEGFGIDPLNSIASGVPVVVSSQGALPEVVGDAGVFVDPYSTESIADGIRQVLRMTKGDYNSIVAKGIKRAQQFSWEATARKTLSLLESI
jgi:glycosyltransferase involved in cell wall biosynthesis